MPIHKFRSLSEAGRATQLLPRTDEFSRALRSVFWMAARFASAQKCPPGVHKFRTIEEAQEQKKLWAHRTTSIQKEKR